jgi:hypothetical protein
MKNKRQNSRNNYEKFHNNLQVNLEIRPSQIPSSGNGLFTGEPIYKGDFLGYYEAQWSFDKKTQSNYSFFVNNKIWLDVDLHDKPYSAMMNDAFRTDYHNNIEAIHLLTEKERNIITKNNCELYDSNKMVGIYAIDDINVGDELFFSYGDYYWKSW